MKKGWRLAFSFVITAVLFASVTLITLLKIFSSLSNFFTNLILPLPITTFYLLYLAAFIIVFLFIFLLFSLKKDYSAKIKTIIEGTQFELINEYLENLELIEWNQLVAQLNQRKQILTEELKQKFSRKSEKYTAIINDTVSTSWEEIENVLKAHLKALPSKQRKNVLYDQNNSFVEKTTDEDFETVFGDVDEVIYKSIEHNALFANNTETDVAVLDDEVFEEKLEELQDLEEINPLEVIGELEEIVDFENKLEDAEQIDVLEEIIDIDDDICELEEIKELEDSDNSETKNNDFLAADDEICELEEIEPEDSYPNLLCNLENKPVYVATSNKTFISTESDNFANVDNIFAEDLCIGSEYTHNYAATDAEFVFMPTKLGFLVDSPIEEPLPVDKDNCFSFTRFGDSQECFSELEEEKTETIIESNGVFSIAENLSFSNIIQDKSFKELVDSILR